MSTPAEVLEQVRQPHTIEEIREALKRMHHVAIGRSDRAYMSIPADPKRDADLILWAAVDELEQLRAATAALADLATQSCKAADLAEAERDEARTAADEAEAVQHAQEERARELIAEAEADRAAAEAKADAESKLGTVLAAELAAEKLAHQETQRERKEARADLADMRLDRDSMKAWVAALFAHVVRLSGASPVAAPQEIQAIAKTWAAEHRRAVIEECAQRLSGCDCNFAPCAHDESRERVRALAVVLP